MAFKDMMGKAQELTGAATEAAGKFVDEFNEALPTLRALGFTVKDLHVGMGFTPDIGAKLVASTDTIETKKIQELIDKHPNNTTLTTALKTLMTAYNVKQQFAGIPFKGVELDVKLGLPPHVGVSFVTAASAAAASSGGGEH